MTTRYSADQIVELEFLEAVRRRPGMYIGNNNLHGLHHILLEVLDNSVDEAMAGFATRIKVTIEKEGTVVVEDDGRGIPVEYKPESGMSALTQVLLKPARGRKVRRRLFRLQQLRRPARHWHQDHQRLLHLPGSRGLPLWAGLPTALRERRNPGDPGGYFRRNRAEGRRDQRNHPAGSGQA